ncbi:leucine-rich repeat protein [Phosphitispora fastidiosa]|uniref:leucine-rich repeat protein n=1 Tax=Phosphitispora fastidiosa TaxID=2837202 RepID=UPI001E55ECF0|nr:leucine-rich repeat protein [Phosphitispora fastidiosa]MBU7006037.1 hypothetical protein [Phosphitispora fastidiosa]
MCKKTLTWFLTVTMILTMFAAAPLPASAGVDGDWLYSLYDDGTTAAITGYIGTDTELTIPSELAGKPVIRIASNAFIDNVSITSVTIPDSVLRIESGAFQNSALAEVDLGQGVTYIGQHAFYGTNLTILSVPNSVETIDFAAFADCSALADITIVGNNLDTLGQGAFSGTAITEISIPTSLSIIDDITFQYCTALTSVTIPANIMNIGYSAFNGCTALTSAVFEGDAPVMENFVFSSVHEDFTVYFYTGAAGFTTPIWSIGLMDYPCVEAGASDTTAPVLTAGEANRISDTEAIVDFTSNEPGYYYYSVVEDGAGEPIMDTGTVGTDCDTTEQTIMLNTLTAGAKDIYIVAKDAAGNVSEKLKMDIEVYQDPSPPSSGSTGTETDATLTGLSVSGITLTPEFDSNTTNYSAGVGNSTATTTITAEITDPLAVVLINDTERTSKEVTLAVGENTVTIVVTAADGITTQTYTIVINRAASSSTSSSPSGGSTYAPPAIIVAAEEADSLTIVKTAVSAQNLSGTASVNISSAIIDALLDKAAAEAGTSKGDIIEVAVNTQGDIEKLEVSVPQSGLLRIANETDAGFVISSPFVSISLDNRVIDAISAVAGGDDIIISASIIDKNTLSEADNVKVDGRPVYDFTIINEDTLVSDFSSGYASVTIPYTLQIGENPNSVVVYFLSDDGSLQSVRGYFDSTKEAVIFKTNHFSRFAIGYNAVSFSDVPAGVWYKEAVEFIAARGITSGTGDGSYSPDMRLTRGQFIVLLMNAYQIAPANGADDNTGNTSSFADAGNTYYTSYLAAAKSLGIAKGVGNNMFAPDKEITRQEMFVLLYNALQLIDELPAAAVDKEIGTFDDAGLVAPWANEAMSALVQSDIVSGSDNMLSPAETTTRAQMAQVLYNLLAI